MNAMRSRRLAAWLLSLPLMIAGTEVAHVLAYELVYPDAHVRLSRLLTSGHAYMFGPGGYLPMVLGLVGALDLVAVGWVFAGSFRSSLQRPVPPAAFALLPPLCFIFQELLERWLYGGSFPWWAVLQPTFGLGLALQLPFALLAFIAARLLLRAAHAAVGSLRAAAPRPIVHRLRLVRLAAGVSPALGELLALCHPGRGPPGVCAAAG